MNKKTLIIVIAVAILAAGAVIFTKFGGNNDETTDNLLVPTAAADIYEASNRLVINEGTATVKRSSGEEEEVTTETDVEVGDSIVVGDDSKATLYWFDHSISRLAAGTEMTIDEAAYNPENINETDIGFEVVTGEVWSKVQAIVDEDSEFLSHAGNVVAGVRGSVYNFAVDGDKVEISSIAHAIQSKDEVYTSGEWGIFDKETNEVVEWGMIPDEKLEGDWFKGNMENDEVDQKRIMKNMMMKLKKVMGALPGEPEFPEKMAKMEAFMQSDADPAKKAAIKIKVVAMIRALDVLPDDKLYPVKEMLQEKLIMWETDEEKKAYLMKRNIERRLYNLYDWIQHNDLEPAQIKAFLAKFRAMIGEKNEFFHENPELIPLVEKIIAALEAKWPGMKEMEFLRVIDGINDEENPIKRDAPVRPSTAPRDVIEEEAPFHRGESNV